MPAHLALVHPPSPEPMPESVEELRALVSELRAQRNDVITVALDARKVIRSRDILVQRLIGVIADQTVELAAKDARIEVLTGDRRLMRRALDRTTEWMRGQREAGAEGG